MKHSSLIAITALAFLTTPFISPANAKDPKPPKAGTSGKDATDKKIETFKKRIASDVASGTLSETESSLLNRQLDQIAKDKERLSRNAPLKGKSKTYITERLDKVEESLVKREKTPAVKKPAASPSPSSLPGAPKLN